MVGIPLYDVYSMSSGSSKANDHCLFDAETVGSNTTCTAYGYSDPAFTSSSWYCSGNIGAGYVDPGQLHASGILGVAAVPDQGNAIWTVEDGSYPYANRWLVDPVKNTLIYANAYFGTGINTDDDEGLQYGLDIAGREIQPHVCARHHIEPR